MPKIDKVRVNVRERVEDNVCDLSLSELSEVPVREIASFKRVTILDLSSNRLMTLGKNFSMLTRLIKLDLSKNQIKYLPEDFGLLRNLRHLDLYDNKLEHLPLSFGNLNNLRYLDLNGNPLMAALGKIVGHCLTTKDCQNSARNTVKFLAHMQLEAEKEKKRYQLENITQQSVEVAEMAKERDVKRILEEEMQKNHNNRKSNKKSKQAKKKKAFNQNTAIDSSVQQAKSGANNKSIKSNRKSSNFKSSGTKMGPYSKSSAALTSIIVFLLLLAINVLLIYMITFKNPEIADKLVEFIPPQYRDWILTKTEIFRLRVSDWIEQFRTTPEEN